MDQQNKNRLHLEKDEASIKKRIDIHSTDSDLSGLLGFVEKFLRKYKFLAFVFAMIPIAFAYVFCLGLSITPGYLIVTNTYALTDGLHLLLKAFLVATSIGIAYLSLGISLVFIVPIFNKLIPFSNKTWRGNWFSVQTIPWYYHNSLVQLVRYTFLDLMTPTPLNLYFYKAMGMKIGKNCIINTSNISDPCLIELEDNVTIGGSVTIFGHYAQGGVLIFAPVKIKKGATIGLKASIMGDVIVGEGVVVPPHQVLLPKTRLEKEIK